MYAIVTVGEVTNVEALATGLRPPTHFSDTTGGEINPTEVIGKLVLTIRKPFEDGIRNAQEASPGSCSRS